MSLVTGTVQLSLAEVDSLRDQIKDKEAKVKELEAELVGVKADKRIMKVTKKVFGSKNDYMITFDERLYSRLLNSTPNNYGYAGPNHYHSREDMIKAAITLHPMTSGMKLNEEKIEFVNMDDVKETIREDLTLKFQQEIRSLKDDQRYYADNVASIKRDHSKAVEDLKEIIAEKDKAYEDLLMDKQEKTEIATLQEVVAKLTEELSKEKSKPWYKKLFI